MFVWHWLNNVRLDDPVERRLAPLLQLVLIALIVIPAIDITSAIVRVGAERVVGVILLTLAFQLTMAFTLRMLRRGRFKPAVRLLMTLVFLAAVRGVFITNLLAYREVLVVFFIPLTIAGLLLSRRMLILVYVLSVVIIIWAANTQNVLQEITGSINFYVIYAGLISFLLDLLGSTLRKELKASQVRNQELEQARKALEMSSRELTTVNNKLVDLNERLTVTLKSIGDAVITTDVEGRVTFMNEVAQMVTGWRPEDAQERPITEVFRVINEDSRQTTENPVERVLREGMIVSLANHTLLITKDGREVPIDDSGAPIRAAQGEIQGAVLVFRDITERKAVEKAREALFQLEREAREEAEKANQLKLQFLGMISHELRTPLTSIKGFSTTLLADDVEWTPDSQRQFIRVIDEEADRLTDLVEHLLDVSRIQSGTLRISLQSHKVEDFIAGVQPQLERLAQKHQLILNVEPNLPPIKIDQFRITQVLDNLVENAVKYSPEKTPIEICLFRQDGFVQVDVADQGIGIPPEERPHVFEAFRQVERAEPTKGAGLGLAICKGLIEAHGGRIWIQDKNPGTTISLTLPLASDSAE
jgi:PAS domain S-box-containing protein